MESLWRRHLKDLQWSDRAQTQCTLSWAPSTLQTYNRQLCKLQNFCAETKCQFPPLDTATIANFLCHVADASPKPRSVLRCTIAALTAMYQASGTINPVDCVEINRLVVALEKTNTQKPMLRSSVMPVQPFVNLFESWSANELLDLKHLRLKAITLLALSIMARPSDLAPKGVFFKDGVCRPMTLTTDQLVFHDNGTLTIQLFGIKNDTRRKGFSVTIPQADNKFLDPVACLKAYIRKSMPQRMLCTNNALFVSLKQPYGAISASSIGEQLNLAIKLAGLDGQGFSAKSFRPTAATVAIATGCDPDIARKIGRWECPSVFYDHYVHSKTPADYVNKLLQHE